VQLLKLILCIFLPPVAVAMHRGIGVPFFINIVLTLFGIIPGTIHGMFVVLTQPEGA
jgi:uncharacterized membrane protein YqaE (UPF0057 family)